MINNYITLQKEHYKNSIKYIINNNINNVSYYMILYIYKSHFKISQYVYQKAN